MIFIYFCLVVNVVASGISFWAYTEIVKFDTLLREALEKNMIGQKEVIKTIHDWYRTVEVIDTHARLRQ